MTLERIEEAILVGDTDQAAAQTREALAEGIPALKILKDTLIVAMDTVDREYESEER